ncbi:hypothetical protein CEJ39_16970 [Rhodococcus pyridinivorans]|uniref:SGNH/GDSL hydrolase family protein n=1 Tax=Rhodococcus pyridinivorans TaxID=103816 RepID=UPI000DCABBC2|nr:SGNH/GDSL hydrolase family protein [Rhodococcus pyridinivorans]AWZ25636.1 hypothetical protein CEJ39_16970 [Rhodococcus pyridinivorans]
MAGSRSCSYTGASKTRLLQSTIMPGITDLLIVALGTNDQSQQVPLAEYRARLQDMIDTQVGGSGCVLLLGEPPASAPTGTLTEQNYRDTMKALAQDNTHVAFTDMRDLYGPHAEAFGMGLYPTNATVHPSAKGAGVMANAVAELLLLPRYA